MSDKDYHSFLTSQRRSAAVPRFAPDIAAARDAENGRRWSAAQQRALRALSRMYHEDYAELLGLARIDIDSERGPMPGDEAVT